MKVLASQTHDVPAKKEGRRPLMVALICLGLFLALMFRFSGLAYGSMSYLGLPITLLSMTAQNMLGFENPLECHYNDAESMVSMGNVSRCVVMPMARIVGGICVTFGSFCSEQSIQEWTEEFMRRNESATDVFVDESSVTLLGQDKDVSWRIRALADELDEEQTRILFSALRKGSHLSEDQINALGFAAMRHAVNEQLRARQGGRQMVITDGFTHDWPDDDSVHSRNLSGLSESEGNESQGSSPFTRPAHDSGFDYEDSESGTMANRARSSAKTGQPSVSLKRYREGG